MKTYLFDFDGTLVDSMPTYVSIMLRILDENHISYGEDLVKVITPLGFVYTAKYFRNMGLDMEEDAIIETMHRYALHEYTYNIQAKPNVIEVIRELKAQGHNLNLLTASPHATLDPCLKRLGLYDLFTNVWSCEDFHTSKADPAIYRMAAEKIGVPVESVLFLDDNLDADMTAKTAGMQVCGVYDPSSKEYEAQMRAVCDGYIYNFKELLEMK